MPALNLLEPPDPPDLLRVPSPQWASNSSASFSSTSSYGSTQFDQRSKSSQFTDLTLVTPLDSVDSIFGNDPDLRPFPRLADPSWDGLTDEQWRQHSRMAQARFAVDEAREAITRDLDKAFQLDDPWLESECSKPDHEFDAVAAVRRRLLREEPTANTRRALEIIDQRSKPRTNFADASRRAESCTSVESKIVVTEVEDELEDYADDFELGTQEVLEISASFDDSHAEVMSTDDCSVEVVMDGLGLYVSSSGSSIRTSVLEQDVPLSPFRYNLDVVMPPRPEILPVDAEWDCPSFTSDLTSIDSISQMPISPFQLDHLPLTSSPAILDYLSELEHQLRSPTVAVSSFTFRSRRPLPISLLDESLDIATVMHLEVTAAMAIDHATRDTPRAGLRPNQPVHGLGFEETMPSDDDWSSSQPCSSTPKTPSSSIREKVQIPSLKISSPSDADGSPHQRFSIVPNPMIEPSGVLSGSPETSTERFLETVTADSDHPAAAPSFVIGRTDPSLCESGDRRGLGLGLPSVFTSHFRPPPTMSTAEECEDLAALSMGLSSTRSRFKRRLSTILEAMDTPSTGVLAQETAFKTPSIRQEDKKDSLWKRFRQKMRWFTGSRKVARSPGMIEHLDAPRGLGLFSRRKRGPALSPSSPGQVGFMRRKLKVLF